jgi:DNA (cytosine-5)-methyltransferase 1
MDFESETFLVQPVTHALRAEGFDASEDGTGRGTPLVPVAVPLQEVGKRTGVSTDDPRAGIGIGQDGDPMFTLQAGAQHGVAVSVSERLANRLRPTREQFSDGLAPHLDEYTPVAIPFHPTQDPISSTDGTTHALGCGSKGGQASVAVSYAFQPRIARNGRGDMGDIVNALNAQSGETGKGDAAPCVAIGVQASQSGVRLNETVGTLDANYGSRRHNGVMQSMAVRRLTPVECERLQGFPDGHTAIPWRGKPAADCPDGPRYKALGNSMAVPVMAWIGRRIAAALEAGA